MKIVKTYETVVASPYGYVGINTNDGGRTGGRLRRRKERHSQQSRRQNRIQRVRSVFENPDELRECHNVRIECARCGDEPALTVRRTPIWSNDRGVTGSPSTVTAMADTSMQDVVVAIEATHICSLDVEVRRGSLESLPAPFVTGTNFVGVVHSGHDVTQGTRVGGIVPLGANARYITTTRSTLIPLPPRADESELAVLLSTYLPMFQALHHGFTGRRYGPAAMSGKRVLLSRGASLSEISAATKLATLQGAMEVFAVCSRKEHAVVNSFGAVPLDEDTNDWYQRLQGRIDLALVFDYYTMRETIHSLLSYHHGRLVWIRPSDHNSLTGWLDQALLSFHDRAFIYSIFASWNESISKATVRTVFVHVPTFVYMDVFVYTRACVYKRERERENDDVHYAFSSHNIFVAHL